MRKAIVISTVSLAVLGLVALFAGKDIWKALDFGAPEGTAVRMEPVEEGVVVETVSAPGIVEPIRKVDISAEVSARIVELPRREGDRVRAGDLLMRLDDRDLKAALQSAEARRDGERYRLEAERSRIVGSQNNLENAKAIALRQESLFRAGDVSRQSYEDAVTRARDLESQFQAQKNTIVQLEKSLAAAEAAIEQQREALRRTVVVAAIDGVVTQLNAEVGELVVVGTMNNPGTKIMTIADLSRMKLTAKVSETDVPRVAKGQSAEVRINGYKNRVFKGVVDEVALSRTVEAKDGTGYFKTAVLLDLGGEQVFSGLGGNVEVSIAAHSGVHVPSQAVVERKIDLMPEALRESPLVVAGKKTVNLVFRVVDGKAVATVVATGASNLTNTVIADGLKAEETVITGPYKVLERLKDGDAVHKEFGGWDDDSGGDPSGGMRMGGGPGRGGRMRF
ncbi:MAG: efflux RND transporter periplasmic adaptor subunit [Planctomycetes bacterium]|nr:efflux RND transporter periplasmic adaptor subunit [Planctomycetota bacterium]